MVRVVVATALPTMLLARLGRATAADGDAIHDLVVVEEIADLRAVGLSRAALLDPEVVILKTLLNSDR